MTRSLYHVLNSRSSWNSNVQLTDEAIREIMIWKLNARSPNGPAAWPTESKPSKIVYSDASDCIAVLLLKTKVKYFSRTGRPMSKRRALLGGN